MPRRDRSPGFTLVVPDPFLACLAEMPPLAGHADHLATPLARTDAQFVWPAWDAEAQRVLHDDSSRPRCGVAAVGLTARAYRAVRPVSGPGRSE